MVAAKQLMMIWLLSCGMAQAQHLGRMPGEKRYEMPSTQHKEVSVRNIEEWFEPESDKKNHSFPTHNIFLIVYQVTCKECQELLPAQDKAAKQVFEESEAYIEYLKNKGEPRWEYEKYRVSFYRIDGFHHGPFKIAGAFERFYKDSWTRDLDGQQDKQGVVHDDGYPIRTPSYYRLTPEKYDRVPRVAQGFSTEASGKGKPGHFHLHHYLKKLVKFPGKKELKRIISGKPSKAAKGETKSTETAENSETKTAEPAAEEDDSDEEDAKVEL